MSYSRVAQQIQFPKKDQAVVTDAIEGITIKDYTLAIGKIVKPVNILFVSRISNSRICVYLRSQELVNKLTEPGMKINIDTYTMTLRPLISKAKRTIISNVCPIIPHYIIEDKIKTLGITPASQMTCIKASINDPEYSHVMSFRRQVYLNPEDFEKLPNSMEIEYEQTTYWIYFSNDKVGCYLCKEEGHLAKDCKAHELNKNAHTIIETDVENSQNKSIENENHAANSITEVEKPQQISPPYTPMNAAFKRTSSVLSGSTLSESEQIQAEVKNKDSTTLINQSKNKPKEKRVKITTLTTTSKQCSQEEIDTLIAPAKNFFLINRNEYPLDFDRLAALLKESHGNANIPELTKKFSSDTKGLIKMLKDTYPFVERKLKLENKNTIEEEDTSNDEIDRCG